jgi:hypothetical protein
MLNHQSRLFASLVSMLACVFLIVPGCGQEESGVAPKVEQGSPSGKTAAGTNAGNESKHPYIVFTKGKSLLPLESKEDINNIMEKQENIDRIDIIIKKDGETFQMNQLNKEDVRKRLRKHKRSDGTNLYLIELMPFNQAKKIDKKPQEDNKDKKSKNDSASLGSKETVYFLSMQTADAMGTGTGSGTVTVTITTTTNTTITSTVPIEVIDYTPCP